MVRTQIYLKEFEYKRAKEKAHREDTSLSESIRRLVRLGLAKDEAKDHQHKRRIPSQVEQILKSIEWLEQQNIPTEGLTDLSTRVDELLYEKP